MEFKLKHAILFTAIGLILAFGIIWVGQMKPGVGGDTVSYAVEYTFFSATTTSATSTNDTNGTLMDISRAKSVTFFFQRGNETTSSNTGTSTFSVQVTKDGTLTSDNGWITYNKLIDNVTNSISQNLTRVGSVQIESSTSTKAYTMDLTNESYKYVRCIVKETIDGEHTCKAIIKY